MQENTPVVSVKNLSHKYGRDWAIQEINFDINQTGIVGLLGSNGAGKSTTMNILCGIIAPTKGQAIIDQYDIKENPIECKKLMGFLPQKAPLYQDLTVDEYLYHCAQLRMIPKGNLKNAIEKVKAYCGVTELSNRLIGNLSGGYQQRVGIAQAIIHKPKLVVLDEPTNGLDPVQITEVRELIKEIAKESAVLLSTHILSEVQATCEKIIMIEKGKMVFNGLLPAFNDLIKPNKLIMKLDEPPGIGELQSIEGVKDALLIEDNLIKLTINERENLDRYLIELSIKQHWGLREIYKEKVSLDMIFAKLSNRTLKN